MLEIDANLFQDKSNSSSQGQAREDQERETVIFQQDRTYSKTIFWSPKTETFISKNQCLQRRPELFSISWPHYELHPKFRNKTIKMTHQKDSVFGTVTSHWQMQLIVSLSHTGAVFTVRLRSQTSTSKYIHLKRMSKSHLSKGIWSAKQMGINIRSVCFKLCIGGIFIHTCYKQKCVVTITTAHKGCKS